MTIYRVISFGLRRTSPPSPPLCAALVMWSHKVGSVLVQVIARFLTTMSETMWTSWSYFNEIIIEIWKPSLKEVYFNVSPAKGGPFCSGTRLQCHCRWYEKKWNDCSWMKMKGGITLGTKMVKLLYHVANGKWNHERNHWWKLVAQTTKISASRYTWYCRKMEGFFPIPAPVYAYPSWSSHQECEGAADTWQHHYGLNVTDKME